MSVEDLKAFGKKVWENPDLKEKAKQIGIDNLEGIIGLAKENGFSISIEDFEILAKDFQSTDELSNDDLEKVAGGNAAAAAAVGAVAVAAGAHWV
ncbi:hypothetical protein JCM14036_08110 [Desulfotomaculum defluvii]